jgi:peptide/nickel transport system substrate-binding protein
MAVAQDDATYNESPMLAALVEAGELPSVAERLPKNPAVVEPFNETGSYGGTLRVGFVGTNPGWGGLWYMAGWENLVIWKPDFSGVAPNIAESWEVSDDVTEYTFYLREGIKWSDGAPFTADDIMFYIEDILFDPDVSEYGAAADWLPVAGAEEFRAEKIDDYTVKFIFAEPNGVFLYNLATWAGRHITFFPKHYLMQFHAKYNENVDELVAEEEGADDWVGLLNLKASGPVEDTNNYFLHPERPLLFPWVIKEPLGASSQIVLERNPYYWKVDSEGNQLPYIDEILGISYLDDEGRTFAMLNGDVDYVKDPGDNNRILYFDAMDAGNPIQINVQISDGANSNSIQFNRTIDDPAKAELFTNKDFRIGMSYAINREELIEIVHFGMSEPAQVAPLESSPLYNEQLATQYIEYDVDLANEYLDKVIPERGDDGMRLGLDGEPLTIVLFVPNDQSYMGTWEQVAEILTGYWAEVGVNVIMNSMPNDQFVEHKEDNVLEAILFTGEGGAGITAILDPRYHVPMEYHGMFGNGWHAWRVHSEESVQVEPPQWIKDYRTQFEVEVLGASSQEAQIAAMQEILQMSADEFWVIGISRPNPSYQVYHERLGNQPEEWIGGWITGVQKLTYPEQWYIIE